MVRSIKDVVDSNLCISCGACCLSGDGKSRSMIESKKRGIYIPEYFDGIDDSFKICPGKGYPIINLGKALFHTAEFEDIELGRWKKTVAAHSLISDNLKNASSGGVMIGIAEHLLEQDLVTGVITTKLSYGRDGPRPESFIAKNIIDLRLSQGSKYAPVPIFEALKNINLFKGRLAFIGTPCQVAALRLLQENDLELKNKIPFIIGNFCGGYRDLRETDKIIDRSGFNKSQVTEFRYRGDGQPGTMLIKNISGDRKKLAYPGYARMTGIVKYRRCRLCVDATAELADFSCGDAWLPKYLESNRAWSIIIARSDKAVEILESMEAKKLIHQESISIVDVKISQKGNLTSKKERQSTRMKLYALMGYKLPEFDGGYYNSNAGWGLELKVYISHAFFHLLERIGMYKIYAKLVGRYPSGSLDK